MFDIILGIVIAVIVVFGIIYLVRKQKKGGGCCGEHEETVAKTKVKDRNKKNYSYKVVLGLGGMTCDNCARKVENALNQLPDTLAKVDISTRTGTVLMKSEPEEAVLRQAVLSAGYVVTDYVRG